MKRFAALALSSALLVPSAFAREPAPYDWSHRHLVYPNPDTFEEALRKGDSVEWERNYADPRFRLSLLRRLESEEIATERAVTKSAFGRVDKNNKGNGAGGKGMHRDWSYVMGGAGGVGFAGTFPAKYNFDISAAPSCANDFVVYPTATSGATGSGNFATVTGTVTGNLGTGTTVSFAIGTLTLTLTSGTTSNLGLNFLGNTGNNNTNATNLANAINRNGGTVGVRASVAANVVTVTALTQGTAANSIVVTGSVTNVTPSGAGLSGGSGTAGQPTLYALNQIYSSCGTATVGDPSLFWSYNTGTGAVVDTSPVISLDGTQVAFIQRTASIASLVLLKWSASTPGTVGAPTAPTSVTLANYRACTAPCMTVMALSGNPNDTNSSPYYDYSSDTLWVGADNGTLHRFTGIFSGTPAESGSPWPVTVVAGRILSSPVYDSADNLVFVGSAREATTSNGGRLHSVNNSTGALISSGVLAGNPTGNVGSKGVAEAPIIDQLAKRVYTFVATDNGAGCSGVQCQAVYQFATNATINGLTTPKQTLGRGDVSTKILFAGIFDNAYYTSTATSPTGALYVCGSEGTGANARRPTLWRIPIAANVMGAPLAGPVLVNADTSDASGGFGACSPITDVQNGANNYIFVSVPGQGSQAVCAGACIYMFNLTGVTAANWTARTAAAGLAAAGGTSGIIIDNSSSVVGASQVYYMTLTSPGNAIQASQAGLN